MIEIIININSFFIQDYVLQSAIITRQKWYSYFLDNVIINLPKVTVEC